MSGLHLLRPEWLWALLPLAGALWWIWRGRALGPWAGIISPEMQAVMQRLGHLRGGGRDLHRYLPLAAASALVVALSGPSLPQPYADSFQRRDPLLLLLDMSPSIVADERALTELKSAAMRVINGANGRPVGLMLYAADAYLASPPTREAETLAGTIAVLSAETMPVAGSRPDIALSMARDLFAEPGRPLLAGADLIVVSDGGGAGLRAVEEATRLHDEGARVWGVALTAAAMGAPAPAPEAMRQLSNAGGGRSYPEPEVGAMLAAIERLSTIRLAADPMAGLGLYELGPWFVVLAMALLLPLFRRGAR